MRGWAEGGRWGSFSRRSRPSAHPLFFVPDSPPTAKNNHPQKNNNNSATCPPAIHQGEPIVEADPRPRPLPLRSAPGVQVLGAPVVTGESGGGGSGDAAMVRLLPPELPRATLTATATAAACAAARMLTAPRMPPVGSAVPLVILPAARVGGNSGGSSSGHGNNGQQQPPQPQPRFGALSLPKPGAWVKLRSVALQVVAPGGELQLLFAKPSKLQVLSSAPGSAGAGAGGGSGGGGSAPHLERRLALRLALGEPAAWASAARGGALVAALSPEELEKAAARARDIQAAVSAHADAAAAAACEDEEAEDGEEDGAENAPPPKQPPKRAARPGSAATNTANVATAAAVPLVTLRQLLSARSRRAARRDAAALAARDAADGYEPRAAYFTRAQRVVVRVASLRPTDLAQWARPLPPPVSAQQQQQRQERWALCGRVALADGTMTAAAAAAAAADADTGAPAAADAVVEALVAPETSEALLGVEAGPLDDRDARARDRLARLAASVARLQAVGAAPPAGREDEDEGGGGPGSDDEDADLLLCGEPTAWVEALLVPRVRLPPDGPRTPHGWRVDYLLTGARLRGEAEVEAERQQRGRGRGAGRGGRAGRGEDERGGSAALAAAVREAVDAAQREARERRAAVEEEGEEAGGGGGRKRQRRAG